MKMRFDPNDPYYSDEPEDEPEQFDEDDCGAFNPEDECRRLSDGSCLLAGSEFCDFECPYRD